jgi:hypothetical protein
MAVKAKKIFIAANNHPRGQAAANAVELKGLLSGSKVTVPETLVNEYPELDDSALPESIERLLVSPDTPEKKELDALERKNAPESPRDRRPARSAIGFMR